MIPNEFSNQNHDPHFKKAWNDFSDLRPISFDEMTETARQYYAPSTLRSAKNVSAEFDKKTDARWRAENTEAIRQLITLAQRAPRPHFKELYRFAAFLRHEIAERMGQRDCRGGNLFGFFRNGQALLELYANQRKPYFIRRGRSERFEYTLQQLGQEKFDQHIAHPSPFVELIGIGEDGKLMRGFNQPRILMKNSYHEDFPNTSRYLSQISFDDYNLGSHTMMHPVFDFEMLEANFEILETLYQDCLACELGENYEIFLSNLARIIHFLANFCPVERGNSAVMGMLMQTLAAQRGIYLGGLLPKEEDELSFDYQAFYVTNPDEYARWFVDYVFDRSQICSLEEAADRFALHNALLANDEARIREALEQEDIDVDRVDSYNRTALHLAIQQGNQEAIERLLARGVNLSVNDYQRKSPLDLAIENGSLDIVRLLINHDPELLNRKNGQRRTPLQTAVASGQAIIFDELFNQEGIKDLTDFEWRSIFFDVVKGGSLDLFRRLFAFVTSNDSFLKPLELFDFSHRNNLLHHAAKHGQIKLINYLLEADIPLNSKNRSQQTPLHLAVIHGQPDVVRALIDRGAELNVVEEPTVYNYGVKETLARTPLDLAIIHGHLDIARLLLEKGANPEFLSGGVTTAFHQAAIHGRLELLCELLGRYPDKLGVTDWYGSTLLHYASEHGQTDIVEELIRRGLDANQFNQNKKTPVDIAARAGQAQAIRVLAQNGGNIDGAPLIIAAQDGHIDTVNVLLELDAEINCVESTSVNQAIYKAVTHSAQVTVVDALIRHGANLNLTNPQGEMLLHLASKRNNSQVIPVLIRSGLDPNVVDRRGRTPLHQAASQFHGEETIRVLLEEGARVNVTNNEGNTPLHVAAMGANKSSVYFYLVQQGADLSARNSNGKRPLEVANSDSESGEIALFLARQMNTLPENPSDSLFLEAVKQNDIELVSQILEQKPDYLTTARVQDRTTIYYKHTALELAVARASRDMVRLLREHGAYDETDEVRDELVKIIQNLPESNQQAMCELFDINLDESQSGSSARNPRGFFATTTNTYVGSGTSPQTTPGAKP